MAAWFLLSFSLMFLFCVKSKILRLNGVVRRSQAIRIALGARVFRTSWDWNWKGHDAECVRKCNCLRRGQQGMQPSRFSVSDDKTSASVKMHQSMSKSFTHSWCKEALFPSLKNSNCWTDVITLCLFPLKSLFLITKIENRSFSRHFWL